MTFAEAFAECNAEIRRIRNKPLQRFFIGKAKVLIKKSAVSVTKDLFNPSRKHYCFIDGSVLNTHKSCWFVETVGGGRNE